MVSLDEEFSVHIVEDAVTVVRDLTDNRRKGFFVFRQIAEEERVPVFAFAALGNVKNREALIFSHADVLKALRVLFVFVNQLIFGLRRAELVIVDGLKLVFAVKLSAFLRLRIAAVEEPFFPAP